MKGFRPLLAPSLRGQLFCVCQTKALVNLFNLKQNILERRDKQKNTKIG